MTDRARKDRDGLGRAQGRRPEVGARSGPGAGFVLAQLRGRSHAHLWEAHTKLQIKGRALELVFEKETMPTSV